MLGSLEGGILGSFAQGIFWVEVCRAAAFDQLGCLAALRLQAKAPRSNNPGDPLGLTPSQACREELKDPELSKAPS